MKKIKTTEIYSKIFNIRKYVFEEILSQIIKGDGIDFTVNKYLKRIEQLRANKEKFISLTNSISQEEAKKSLKNSILQGEEMKKSIFTLSKKEVPNHIIAILEFIYENIIFSESYWSGLDEGKFSKIIFKRKFFEEQGDGVCPYCNSEEDLMFLNFEIDHLLPKTEFPLLYINENNLIPCCKTCNHNFYGKGNRWNDKYYNLFKNNLGLKVIFEFEPEFRITGVDNISDEFLELIKLKDRNKQNIVTLKINSLKKKVFRDLKKQKNNRNFLDINAPNYFLIKAMYIFYVDNIWIIKR